MSTSVCVCLSVLEDISGTTRAIFTTCACCLWPWLGPPPATLHDDTLCTSGFVDDIMFFYNGQYSGMNFATSLRLSLLIYRKVGQNSIFYY